MEWRKIYTVYRQERVKPQWSYQYSKEKLKLSLPAFKVIPRKMTLGKKYIRNAFGEGIPEVSMFDTTKKLRHSKMRLLEYVPAVQKSLAEKKQKYFHYFENELGEKRDDYIIATEIDGCNQGKQIGAGSQGGGKDVTLINGERFNCKETHSVIKRAMQEMSNDKTEMKKLSPSVIQMMKCDLKFHCGPLNGNKVVIEFD